MKDYQRALEFWLTLDEPLIRGVVFADNSGHPLDTLRTCAGGVEKSRRPVEFLSFDFPAPEPTLSYGHAEFVLVNHALQTSELLQQTGYFIKATGRYTFPDIRRLIQRLPADFHVALDCKGIRPFGLKSHPIAPVALALFDRHYFAQHLADLPSTMVPAPPWNRHQFVETVLFDRLYPHRADPRLLMRWPCNCEPEGFGANGDDYSSWSKTLQRTARAATRRLWPRLWI